MLSAADLLTWLDSMAKALDVFDGAVGRTGTEDGTVSGAAVENTEMLVALDDVSVQRDLTPIAIRRAGLLTGEAMDVALHGAMVQRALDRHYGDIGGLNAFLKTNDLRVSVNLRRVGFQIDAVNVMPPQVDPVASYEGTAAGAGNFVAGSNIDNTTYGEAALELVVDAQGVALRTVRVSVTNFDGTGETRDVVIPANSAPGTVIAIAPGRFVKVTGITTIGGGTAADRYRVRSVVERVPAL